MKFKLKNGSQIQLHDEDMEKIYQMWKQHDDEFNFDDMEKYFHDIHKHAMQKMQMISDTVLTDENSIDMAMEKVLKYGNAKDIAKFMRYAFDANVAYHLLESVKN